ncbi:MAG TPA: hypothetical protein IGS37_15220 [Synechococcales cyanobacterium M55_K2018_004]|nr:hypothetical protein [Synechococcales cyanobacterium M55_K2018_004]
MISWVACARHLANHCLNTTIAQFIEHNMPAKLKRPMTAEFENLSSGDRTVWALLI